MRKQNAVLALCCLALFLVHAVAGGFQLMGILPGGSAVMQVLAWLLLFALFLHTVYGIVLTVETVQAVRRAGVFYFRQNALFLARRLSGFALLLLLILHMLLFVQTGSGAYRLHEFGTAELAGQILLVLSLVLHLLCNLKPLAVAFGLHKNGGYLRDFLLVLSVLLVFCTVAFLIYYLRWNVLWR